MARWNIISIKQNSVSENLLQLISNCLSRRFQRVLVHGQKPDWETIRGSGQHGSILGLLSFLIYVNDLTNNLKGNVKPFADDTFLYSETCDPLETVNILNNDLRKIRKWAKQWKIVFNPDPTKQA